MNSRESSGQGDGFGTDAFTAKLSAAINGSKEQQAKLLEPFREHLRQFAIHAIASDAGRAQLSVSDLVQSAIIKACSSFENCRATGEEEFKAWLEQILVSDILERYRFLRRQEPDVASSSSPDEESRRTEEERKLFDAIEKLTPEHQQVIRMRHHDKMSFVEIGKLVNRSVDETRMLWYRAVEELSKVI